MNTVIIAIFLLILGFSFAGFMVDFGYLRKKLKVIVARDALVKIVLDCNEETGEELKKLMEISGEADITSFSDKTRKAYQQNRNWNLKWILFPLYLTTPIVAFFICLVCRIFERT